MFIIKQPTRHNKYQQPLRYLNKNLFVVNV